MFSVKGQSVNILAFVCHAGSAKSIPPAVGARTQSKQYVSKESRLFPNKFYF